MSGPGHGRAVSAPMDGGVIRERPAALGTKVYWPLSEGLWISLEQAVLSFPLLVVSRERQAAVDLQKFPGPGVERRGGRKILVSLVIGEDMSLLQLSFSVCVFSRSLELTVLSAFLKCLVLLDVLQCLIYVQSRRNGLTHFLNRLFVSMHMKL